MTRALAPVLLVALVACGGSPTYLSLEDAQRACARGAQHAELTIAGRVTRVLGVRSSRSGAHEGFVFTAPVCSPQHRPCASANLRVEDNVDITGEVPIEPGDAVTVRGQYECNDGVMHWTHHDPQGRHVGGFIDVNGVRYQ